MERGGGARVSQIPKEGTHARDFIELEQEGRSPQGRGEVRITHKLVKTGGALSMKK